ncbi:SIMPL domain-containing protein [Paenibacillus sp. CMAA1364]
MMKWVKRTGLVLVAGAFIVGVSSIGNTLANPSEVSAAEVQRNIINVVGKGEISVTPDIAYLSIGVTSQVDTAQAAQKANATKMKKLNDVLKNTWKIADKDIKSTQFNVQPNYVYTEKEGQKVKGYNASHTIEVTYRDLTKVGELLDAASTAGANNVENIRFSIENRDQFETQVIDKAMANATLKAGAIAKAANRQLGVVLVVSQGNVDNPVVYAQNESLMAKADMDSNNSTTIEAGEIKVSTQLSVQYEMK